MTTVKNFLSKYCINKKKYATEKCLSVNKATYYVTYLSPPLNRDRKQDPNMNAADSFRIQEALYEREKQRWEKEGKFFLIQANRE